MKRKGILHSILLRYMISYAAVMAVLFAGVGIYMASSFAGTIRANTVESSVNKLSAIRSQHEEKLDTLLSTGSQIGLSPYISSFRLLKEPMKAFHLKMQLVPYTITNDFCSQLYLIFNEDDYLYSSATSVGLEMFLYKLMLLEDTPPEVLRSALRRRDNGVTILPAQNVTSILTAGTNNRMAAVIVPVGTGERYNTGNLFFLINESTYQKMFADEIYEPHSTYIFYGDSALAASRGIDVADREVLSHLTGLADIVAEDIVLGGSQYLLVAEPGHRYDMVYATLLPMETLKAGMTRAQLGFGLFLFSLSLPCMVLTFYISRRHVKPIKELRYLFSSTLPDTDDFKAIHRGIEALVDRNEALNTRLDQSLPMRKSEFIKDFVKGRYPSREEAVRTAAQLDMPIDRPFFAVALLGEQANEDSRPDVDKIADCAGESVTGFYVELLALEQYLFVLFADSADLIDIWAEKARSEAMGAALSLSAVHRNFSHVGNAYLEAGTAFDNRFVMGGSHVLRFSDVSAAAKDIVPFTRTYLDGFRKALKAGDSKALNDRMDELFHYLGSSGLSLYAFRMIYNSLIGVILAEQMERQSGDADALLQYYDVFTLSGCRSVNDLDDLLRRLCREILPKEEKESGPGNPLIRQIIGYMNERYAEPAMSMSAIADHFSISAVRLSLDFKEITGMAPSEYLLLVRMEKAKELLIGTALSVREIGQAVGYCDASGFIRRFRQHMAMTPAQYRQMAAAKGAC